MNGTIEIRKDDFELHIIGVTKNDPSIMISIDDFYAGGYRANADISIDEAEKIARFLLSEVDKYRKGSAPTE